MSDFFVTPWTVVPFSSFPQSFPVSGSLSMTRFFTSGGQSIGASASVLPMNIKSWFPLGLTGLISLLPRDSQGLLQHHSLEVSVLWHSAFFMVQTSHLYMTTGKTIALISQTFVWKECKWTQIRHQKQQHLIPEPTSAFYQTTGSY